MMPSPTNQLCSSFTVKARIKCSYHTLKASLLQLCYLKPLSTGTELVYVVQLEENSSDNPILRLSRGFISFKFFFSSPSAVGYAKNFAMFSSILGYLVDSYEVRMESIYGYMAEIAIRGTPLADMGSNQNLSMMDRQVSAFTAVNCSLAHELVQLSKERSKLLSELKTLRAFCKWLLRSVQERGVGNASIRELISSAPELSDDSISYLIASLDIRQ